MAREIQAVSALRQESVLSRLAMDLNGLTNQPATGPIEGR